MVNSGSVRQHQHEAMMLLDPTLGCWPLGGHVPLADGGEVDELVGTPTIPTTRSPFFKSDCLSQNND